MYVDTRLLLLANALVLEREMRVKAHSEDRIIIIMCPMCSTVSCESCNK